MTSRQLCTFMVHNMLLGIDAAVVQEVLGAQPTTRLPLVHPAIAGLINLRGQIVAAIDVRRRLQISSAPPEEPRVTMVVRWQGGMVGLLADRIGDVFEVDEELFEAPPETLKGLARRLIRGAYKLEHALLLVLDVGRLLDLRNQGEM